MKTGHIATYNTERGFGFIRIDSGKFEHMFFHVSQCLCEPTINLHVQFEIGPGRNGPAAFGVTAVGSLAAGAVESLSGNQ